MRERGYLDVVYPLHNLLWPLRSRKNAKEEIRTVREKMKGGHMKVIYPH